MIWATHCAWHPEREARATLAQEGRPGLCKACLNVWRMNGAKALGKVPAVPS